MRISDWSSDVCSSDLHYHAAYVAPRWRSTLERVAQIGAHIFYRNQESARLTGKYSGEEPVLPAILTLERRVGAQGSIQGKHEARTMPTPGLFSAWGISIARVEPGGAAHSTLPAASNPPASRRRPDRKSTR